MYKVKFYFKGGDTARYNYPAPPKFNWKGGSNIDFVNLAETAILSPYDKGKITSDWVRCSEIARMVVTPIVNEKEGD